MFKCSQCPQTFVQKGNLISHVAKCHTYKEGEPSFPCNQCSCIFKKIGTLNAHISKFHTSQGVFVHPDDDLGFKVDEVMQQLNELHRANPLEAELMSKELFFNLPVTQGTSEEVFILKPSIMKQIKNVFLFSCRVLKILIMTLQSIETLWLHKIRH